MSEHPTGSPVSLTARIDQPRRWSAKHEYPPSVFDLLVGIYRWAFRVVAYVALMTDEYPPFRLDQGPDEPPAPVVPSASVVPPTAPAAA